MNSYIISQLFGFSIISLIVFLLYRKRKIIRFQKTEKGYVYFLLHKKIRSEKKTKEYNPYYIINEYFSKAQYIPDNYNVDMFNDAKIFWYKVFSNRPQDLVSKLEDNIEIADISYFEKYIYSNNYPQSVKNILIINLIVERAFLWARTPGKREQAARLGCFVLKEQLIEADSTSPKDWLAAWNRKLSEVGEFDPLTSTRIILNAWDEKENRTEIGVKKCIKEIYDFFIEINWKAGLKIIEESGSLN